MGPVGLPEDALRHRGAQPEGRAEVGRRRKRGRLSTTWAREPGHATSKVDAVGRPRASCKPGDCCPEVRHGAQGRARHRGVRRCSSWATSTLRAMDATFMDEDGKETALHHGLLRRGRRRATLAAIVEQHNDENGIDLADVRGSGARVRPAARRGRRPGAARCREAGRASWRAWAWKWSSTTARSARA